MDYKINIDSKYPITTIDEIANLNEFTYNPTNTNKDYKYVDISSVSNGNINYSSIIKGTEAPSRARRIATKDSVLISTVRPNLRAFAYVEDEVEDSIYSTGFAILRTKDKMTLLPRYLYYMFMNYEFTMMQIKAMMPKGMYPSINANNIKSIRIPLPPIDIQKKIADECKKVDDKVVVALDELSSSQEGLTSLLNSISSNEVRLESICYVKGGERIPKGMGYSASETNHPYLRVSDFKDGSIDTSDMHYVSDSVFEHIKNYTISVDDVYISIAGTIGLVGIIPTILDGANLTENAAKMIIKDHNLLIKEYLYLVFNSSRVQMQIEAETKSIGVPKLALHRIESLLIPYIEKNKQEEIVKKAAPFIKTIARAKYIIQQAASHKQAIIDKYLK
ncbi:restriction endonuclease subunit S [Parabacteroides distasonis]|nr:restriction endonuclease subunit S [Parabacteroides distasonis]